MPIDTSMYSTVPAPAPAQQPNLLGIVGQYAQAQNALNQNQQFQQEFAARRAIGAIAQESVDPKSGEMNWQKFMLGISTHPETAWKAPDIINSIVGRQLVEKDIALKTLDLHRQQFGAWGDALGGLWREGRNGFAAKDKSGAPVKDAIDPKNLLSTLSFMHSQYGLDQGKMMEWLTSPEMMSNGQLDPKKIFRRVEQLTMSAVGRTDMLNSTVKALTTNRGGSTDQGTFDPASGQYRPAQGTPSGNGSFSQTPTVDELSKATKGVNPRTGEETTGPAASFPGTVQTQEGPYSPKAVPTTSVTRDN